MGPEEQGHGPRVAARSARLAPGLLATGLLLAVVAVWILRVTGEAAWPAGRGLVVGSLFCAAYVAWLASELRVALREEALRYADHGTRELYGAAHAATILAALWFAAPQGQPAALLAAGAALFAAGVALRVWAIRTLGRFYSHSVRTLAGHSVVEGGPYRRLRHPAYAGMLLAHAGVVAFFFSLPALAALLLGLVPAVVVRLRVEERAMRGVAGYAEFARARKRLVPGVW